VPESHSADPGVPNVGQPAHGLILRAPPSHSRAPAWGCGIVQACAGPWSFGSVAEYAAFLRPRLRPTTRLVAVAGERKGDRGTFLESNSESNSNIAPCQVQWDAFGKPFWVRWSDVALEVRPCPHPSTSASCNDSASSRSLPSAVRHLWHGAVACPQAK
jgi:hypothetical protein